MKKICSLFLSILIMLSCCSISVSAQRDVSEQEKNAAVLKDLGLFKGVSDTEFDLGRAPSRVEALVMLIRVLGKEGEALDKDRAHPFTDVPEWADKYVGYAYESKLTNGQSATQFGTGEASAAMFVTFVLRALGYSDTNGEDFVWSDPFTLAKEIGVVTDSVELEGFLRADVVTIAVNSLDVKLKNSETKLYQKLIEAGVFTEEKYAKYFEIQKQPEELTELSAEKIYEKCSPAVFYIEICDASKNPIGSASGFFIDDKGTAVTNYHVIAEAYSANAQLSSGTEEYEIEGYYDYDKTNDWAIIKVKTENNAYLVPGDSNTVVGGASVYAIGSPLGLQNTISQGIISNAARVDEKTGVTFIQFSAPISSGSSGGALINKYGQVIGITSAGYRGGQNINLAIPISAVQNYKNETVSLFNPLGFSEETTESDDPIERQQLAFSVLKEFILSHGQGKNSDGYITYRDTQYGTGVQIDLSIYYNGTDDVITASVIYDYDDQEDVRMGLSAHFSSYAFTTDVDYFYEVSHSPTTASGTIDNAEFFGPDDTVYIFDTFSGHTIQKDQHEKLACSMHSLVLVFVQQIFKSAMVEHGEFSIDDLGYVGFEV